MQMKSLLVFLPLLLEPASSLVIPLPQDTCADFEALVRRGGDVHDVPEGILRRCGQLGGIEDHRSPFGEAHERGRWPVRPGIKKESEGHSLEARARAKKKTKPKKAQSSDQQQDNNNTPPQDSTSGTPAKDNNGQVSLPDRTKPAGQAKQPSDKSDNESENKPDEQKLDKGKGKATEDVDENKSDANKVDANKVDANKVDANKVDAKNDDENWDDVPLSKDRKNQVGVHEDPTKDTSKNSENTMYHIVTPNPVETEALKNRKTGERYFYRKVGDGNVNNPSRYPGTNPEYSAVQSHGQEAKEGGKPKGVRPGKVEEKATTGAPKGAKKDEKTDSQAAQKDGKTDGKIDSQPGGPSNEKSNERGTEWYKITAKKQEDLPEGKTAWNEETLAKNMIDQQKNFKNHNAGDKNDKFGTLTQEMLTMCTAVQCKKGQAPVVPGLPDEAPVPDAPAAVRRAIEEMPILRRRVESLLRERDELFEMAMRR